MNTESGDSLNNMEVDVDNLYREEVFTDLQLGSFRRLNPVKPDGSPDESRKTLFTGHAQLMSQAGLLPVSCPIEAETLEDAIAKFPEAIKQAVEKMVAEAQEVEREQASRIIQLGKDTGYIHKP